MTFKRGELAVIAAVRRLPVTGYAKRLTRCGLGGILIASVHLHEGCVMTRGSSGSKWLSVAGIAVTAAVLGGLFGFALGQRQGMAWGERLVSAEAGLGTISAIDAATLLREGRPDGALRDLDWRIHVALDNFSKNERAAQFPTLASAIDYARRYRGRYESETLGRTESPGFDGLHILKSDAPPPGSGAE